MFTFFKHKKSVKSCFFPTNAVDAVFLCFLILENTKNWRYPRVGFFLPLIVLFFFCFRVLNLFVGWGVLVWKDVAFWGHGVVPLGNIFPKQSRKKKNEKACSHILSLALTLKVFLECA